MRQELEKTKNQLEAILESIQDGIAVLNSDFTIRYANSTMNEWYEENAPLEGKTCYRVHHALAKPCADCHVLRTLKTGEAAAKIEQPDHNPEVDYLELYSYPMIDDETGEITGIVELSRDISERKKAERELELTKSCLDKANMMFLRVSPEGIIRYANERVCEKLGYDRDELIGSKARRLVAEKSSVLERNEFWQEIKSSGSYVYEREFETKEGIVFPVHLISQYFEYEGEEFEMVFARDIKERKKM
nr:PAS domain S-box protein [Halarsenatibacter silvermanii]